MLLLKLFRASEKSSVNLSECKRRGGDHWHTARDGVTVSRLRVELVRVVFASPPCSAASISTSGLIATAARRCKRNRLPLSLLAGQWGRRLRDVVQDALAPTSLMENVTIIGRLLNAALQPQVLVDLLFNPKRVRPPPRAGRV